MRLARSIAGLLAITAVLENAPALAQESAPASGTRLATARVVDPEGRPQLGVIVFAADAATDAVVAMASSDGSGNVELRLPRRRHDFGVLSVGLGVVRLVSRGPGQFELVVTRLPPDQLQVPTAPAPVRMQSPRAFLVRGRVVDETGAGLEGVRIEAQRASGAAVATTFSAADGTFVVAVPGGASQLRASAPGLRVLRSAQRSGRVLLMMTVSADVQRLVITPGRILSFRPEDSIDPEYTPPAAVKSWLQYAYGICPSAPMKAHEKRALKKYWYLDVLRREPPNPASVSTTTCTIPSAYQPTAAPQATVGGFDIWREGLVGEP